MEIKPVRTKADYRAALKEIETLSVKIEVSTVRWLEW